MHVSLVAEQVSVLFFYHRVKFLGAHRANILRNPCSQSELSHHCRNAPTTPKSWLSALSAASTPIYGVAGHESVKKPA